LDDIRAQRDGADLGDMLKANLAAADTADTAAGPRAQRRAGRRDNFMTQARSDANLIPDAAAKVALAMTDLGPLDEVAGRFVETLAREYRFHVERVAELDHRIMVLQEHHRAEHQADHEEIVTLRSQRERARAGAYAANARAERLEAELAEARAEIERRYTARQVGDAQASEAELVSKPLRDRIASLERGLANEMSANARLANQAADELAVRRESEADLQTARVRITSLERREAELQGWLDCREKRQNEAEARAAKANTNAETLRQSVRVIADAVSHEAVTKALDPDTMDHPDYRATLRDQMRQVRHEVQRIVTRQALISPVECSHPACAGPTCDRLEGHPGRS
jgi:chromosome segregation ATPase